MRPKKRVSDEDARTLLRATLDAMEELPPNVTEVLALMWGVTDGVRWTFGQSVEKLNVPPEKWRSVESEVDASLRLFSEGLEHGHFKGRIETLLRELVKKY